MAEVQPSANLGQQSVDVTGNKTLTVADSGIIQNVTKDAVVTLPATAAAGDFWVRRGAEGVAVSVAPGSSDGVTGNGYTATVNKAIINTTATGRFGDTLHLRGTGTTGVTGWIVATPPTGVWARAA